MICRRRRWLAPLAAGAMVAGALAPSSAGAQQMRVQFQLNRRDAAAADSAANRIQLVTDRAASRGMKRAGESIAAGEFSQAIEFLDTVLGAVQDDFIEVGEAGQVAGMKQTALRLLRELPPEGRRAYQAAFGPVAQRKLVDAAASGDQAALEEVAQRYFYTEAGYEAALLLAIAESDAGRHLSAALKYQQLLESPEAVSRFDPYVSIQAACNWLAAGDESRASAVLETLQSRGRQSIQIAGREHRLDASADAVRWLRETVGESAGLPQSIDPQWLTYRGNAARNGRSAGGLPHMRMRWEARLLGPPQLETLFENFAADLVRTGHMAPVAGNVLAAGDYILTRTPHGLLAVDFSTGKMVWRSEPQLEPLLEQLLNAGRFAEGEAASPEPARSFARRMWEDYLYGMISSDGERVYVIRDLPMAPPPEYELSPWGAGPVGEPSSQANRLSAYDLRTQGKLVWEIDGAAATGQLADAFFLGAPLNLGPSLFVLAEMKSAVYLVELDRATGEFRWSQPLANLETGVLLNPRRRLQAAMPSYEEGILVCPTGAGVVIGVDMSQRSLAWAYQYDSHRESDYPYRGRDDGSLERLTRRWLDGGVAIAGDRVLLTPPDSNEIHAVHLRSGEPLWKLPRGEMNRLAAADDSRVLLIGNQTMSALRLVDGKPAWSRGSVALPAGVTPSGTGFLSDGKYYLPLTSAEVIAVDMADGQIASRAVSRDGRPMGNLICHRGAVISQNGMHLDCFDQVEVLRAKSEERLAEDSDDVQALRTLGEIAFNEGRLSDAIALLDRAHHADASDLEVQEVLAECLIVALDSEFKANQARLPLLKSLQPGGAERRLTILRIEAQGLLEQGELLPSLQACLELYRQCPSTQDVFRVKRTHETAICRWVQAQALAIWEQASGEQRQAIATLLTDELQRGGAPPQGDQLVHWLAFFGELPSAEPLKLARARELAQGDQPLEAQQLLLDLQDSQDVQIRGEAIARAAGLLHQAGLHWQATELDRQLDGPLAEVEVLDGQTGRGLVQSWSSAPGAAPVHWPQGRVDVQIAPATGSGVMRGGPPLWGVRFERTDSMLGLGQAFISARSGELILQDNLGREYFRVNLEPEGQAYRRQIGAGMFGVSRGNLMVVSMGRQLAALNTLSKSDGAPPPLLWRASLSSDLEYGDAYIPQPFSVGAERPGSFRAPRPKEESNGRQQWMGVIGPVTSHGVVYQDQRRLVCVDPYSGDVRWWRTDVQRGCDLFGDEELLFAVPVGETRARVFSMIDGREMDVVDIPPWHEQLAPLGRHLICWRSFGAGQMELASMDARTGQIDWRHRFADKAAVDIEHGRFVAVVEPGGQATIIDARDGQKLVERPFPARSRVEEVHLAVGSDTFLLAVKQPQSGRRSRAVQAFPMVESPVVDGQMFAFDRRTGEMLWSRPADVIQQALLLMQPVDLPLIVFAGQATGGDGAPPRPTCRMLILDKATGRTLFQSDDMPQPGNYCMARVTDLDNRRAAIEMAGRAVVLHFTEGRRPPEPPPLAEVESGAAKPAGGLMGIIFGAGG